MNVFELAFFSIVVGTIAWLVMLALGVAGMPIYLVWMWASLVIGLVVVLASAAHRIRSRRGKRDEFHEL